VPRAAVDPGPLPDAANDSDIDTDSDEQVKVIGSLRIPIPLFNIYLNEADELSRRLCTELAEWGIEHERRPVSESSVVLAHSLAGSSATVGYAELSSLARALEHVLIRAAALDHGSTGEPALYNEAADEIRRLLHQFAAGFLKPMTPGLLERLLEHEKQLASADRRRPPAETAAGVEERPRSGGRLAADEDRTSAWPKSLRSTARPAGGGGFDGVDPPPAAGSMPEIALPLEALPAPPARARDGRLRRRRRHRSGRRDRRRALPDLRGRSRGAAAAAAVAAARLGAAPVGHDAPSACMRTLHTFKGGARLAGAMRLGEMAHRLETAIEHLAGTAGSRRVAGRAAAGARRRHGGGLRGCCASRRPAGHPGCRRGAAPAPCHSRCRSNCRSAGPPTPRRPTSRPGRSDADRGGASQSGRLVALQHDRPPGCRPRGRAGRRRCRRGACARRACWTGWSTTPAR
jgi:chemosensory pili system protein ChpA (sensor histidine kinase/response regulator)